jgi:tetratricopeptide (TPR) repeat protein
MTLAEEGLRLFRELDHKSGIIFALNMLGELARLDSHHARAGRYYEECLTLSNELENRRHEAISLANLSYVAYHQGDYNRAIDCSKKAVVLLNSLQMEYASAIALATIAGPIGAKGDPKQAARLLAVSETQLEAMGASVQAADRFEVDQFKNLIREQLGETEFNKAWTEGQAMSMKQAVAKVMGET